MSATYRQSAQISPEKYRMDPGNILLARGPNLRLSAEMIRDNALMASGLLNNKVGGPWVKPFQPPGIWKELANQIGENKYRPSRGEDLYRRSLYSYWKRTIPPPAMLTFDAAERAVCVVKRQQTNTPLQALVLLNDPQFVESARVLAARMLEDGGSEIESQIQFGFQMLTSRTASHQELKVLKEQYRSSITRFNQDTEQAKRLLAVGAAAAHPGLDLVHHAAMTVVANILLNLDEAKMKS